MESKNCVENCSEGHRGADALRNAAPVFMTLKEIEMTSFIIGILSIMVGAISAIVMIWCRNRRL
jgi:hypothetical protein